jgi:hypothetical protein
MFSCSFSKVQHNNPYQEVAFSRVLLFFSWPQVSHRLDKSCSPFGQACITITAWTSLIFRLWDVDRARCLVVLPCGRSRLAQAALRIVLLTADKGWNLGPCPFLGCCVVLFSTVSRPRNNPYQYLDKPLCPRLDLLISETKLGKTRSSTRKTKQVRRERDIASAARVNKAFASTRAFGRKGEKPMPPCAESRVAAARARALCGERAPGDSVWDSTSGDWVWCGEESKLLGAARMSSVSFKEGVGLARVVTKEYNRLSQACVHCVHKQQRRQACAPFGDKPVSHLDKPVSR